MSLTSEFQKAVFVCQASPQWRRGCIFDGCCRRTMQVVWTSRNVGIFDGSVLVWQKTRNYVNICYNRREFTHVSFPSDEVRSSKLLRSPFSWIPCKEGSLVKVISIGSLEAPEHLDLLDDGLRRNPLKCPWKWFMLGIGYSGHCWITYNRVMMLQRGPKRSGHSIYIDLDKPSTWLVITSVLAGYNPFSLNWTHGFDWVDAHIRYFEW